MNNKRKNIWFTVVGLTVLVVFTVVAKLLFLQHTGKEIPEIANIALTEESVREQISEYLKKARHKPTSENLGMLGMVYHSGANYNEAAKCYKLAIKADNTKWIWYYYNGYLQMEMGNPDSVVSNFSQVIKINPAINLAWYYLGNAYKNLKKNELAEESFNKIVPVKSRTPVSAVVTRREHFPLGTYAMFELARIYIDTERKEIAENTLKELIQNYPLFGPAYRLLGNIYTQKGETGLGNRFTVRSNDFISFSPPVDTLMDKLVLLSRSELYLLKKIDEAEKSFHPDWALRLVNQGLQFLPDNKYMVSKAIKVFLWKNLYDQAVGLADKHIQLCADDYIEIKNTGIFFYQKDLFEQAVKYWRRALELKPGETLIQEYLARSLWFSGDRQKPIEMLGEIVAMNPGNVEALLDVTNLFIEFGQKDKAVALLEELKKTVPSNPKYLRMRAEIAFWEGNIPGAVKLYETSLNLDPTDTKTIINLGSLYKSENRWDKYIGLYRKAQEYHPNNPDFLSRLGETLINCPDPKYRNIEEGKYYTERAFTFYNCPPDILVSSGSHLAYAYSLLGEKQKALTTISQTINIARRQNIPAPQQEKLENMLVALQQMEN